VSQNPGVSIGLYPLIITYALIRTELLLPPPLQLLSSPKEGEFSNEGGIEATAALSIAVVIRGGCTLPVG